MGDLLHPPGIRQTTRASRTIRRAERPVNQRPPATLSEETRRTMSDLHVARGALTPAAGRPTRTGARHNALPLAPSTYFDDALFQREADTLFRHGPRYLGHELSVPNPGDYYTLPQEGDGRVLVRTPKSVELISNVCRHRQALILHGRGNTHSNIVCPLHRWTYDLKGQLIGAPHFTESPCLHLNNYKTRSWNAV